MKIFVAKILAKYAAHRQKKVFYRSIELQDILLKNILQKAKSTVFGKDHNFKNIESYEDFKKQIPIRNYEDLLPYINRIRKGDKNVLWPKAPKYWAKTSGTTSGSKYIPITKDSLPCHISAARNALLSYINETGRCEFLNGHMLFLSGSPVLSMHNNVFEGRLSGIVNHHVPFYLKKQYLPSLETNAIEDWHTKLEKILDEALKVNLTVVSGIPPWIQMFFDLALKRLEVKTISQVFPNLKLIVFGGVNFEPYKKKLSATVGKPVDFIETYPASEGFIAFQDSQTSSGLLLQTDAGIFYEFIPTVEFFDKNPKRISLKDVVIGDNYAIIISSNAGLWGYSIGDTVKFISKNPYRIVVTGRIKHFISAFGEHVIGEEIDSAMAYALLKNTEVEVKEFTVAPYFSDKDGEKSFHEWFIEFKIFPKDLELFALDIEKKLMELNPYYRDLITDGVLSTLKITVLPSNSFENYMHRCGMLGGQNKVVHLTNDRKMIEAIMYVEK